MKGFFFFFAYCVLHGGDWCKQILCSVKINKVCKHKYQIFWCKTTDNLHRKMEACKTVKGISRELSTFLLWGKENIIGYKVECYEGWDQVV